MTKTDLKTETSKYGYDADDSKKTKFLTDVADAVPGVGLVKAAYHGVKILATDDEEEKKRHHFRGQRAAGNQLRFVASVAGAAAGALAGAVTLNPIAIGAGAAAGSIAGGQAVDGILPNRTSIVGKCKDGQAVEGIIEVAIDGVAGVIGAGSVVNNVAKNVSESVATTTARNIKIIAQQVCKELTSEAAVLSGHLTKCEINSISRALVQGSVVTGIIKCHQLALDAAIISNICHAGAVVIVVSASAILYSTMEKLGLELMKKGITIIFLATLQNMSTEQKITVLISLVTAYMKKTNASSKDLSEELLKTTVSQLVDGCGSESISAQIGEAYEWACANLLTITTVQLPNEENGKCRIIEIEIEKSASTDTNECTESGYSESKTRPEERGSM